MKVPHATDSAPASKSKSEDGRESFHSTEHWLAPGEVEVTALGDFTSGPRTVVDREALEKVFFLYVLGGETVVRLSDAGEIRLGVDDILVVFPGRQVTVELTADANRLMAVALKGSGAVRAALGLGFFDLLRAKERYEGNFMTEVIERFHTAPDRGRDARVLSLVEHLLSTVWLRVRHGSAHGAFWDVVRTLNGYLCAMEFLTTEKAAAALGMSRSKLNALFMKGAGMRPGDYMAHAVLALSEAALFWTSQPIAGIARKFGFSSSSAFAAFFRRHSGKSPAQFRKRPMTLRRLPKVRHENHAG